MGKLGRLWDRVLPWLICLSPAGAIAYYVAEFEEEDTPAAVIALARP